MSPGLAHLVRRRIAIKLTLTLVGFVALSTLVAGAYLSRAMERSPDATCLAPKTFDRAEHRLVADKGAEAICGELPALASIAQALNVPSEL